jgi:hypothetical protein
MLALASNTDARKKKLKFCFLSSLFDADAFAGSATREKFFVVFQVTSSPTRWSFSSWSFRQRLAGMP